MTVAEAAILGEVIAERDHWHGRAVHLAERLTTAQEFCRLLRPHVDNDVWEAVVTAMAGGDE
jgi:class 3 adenylate cyclase